MKMIMMDTMAIIMAMIPRVCLLLIKSLNTLKMTKVLLLVSVLQFLLSIRYICEIGTYLNDTSK
jgi:hypothetical protein